MPQIESFIINTNTQLGIWYLEESINELLSIRKLNDTEKLRFDLLKSEKRKSQWLATRILLDQLTNNEHLIIQYDSNGKPFLTDTHFLSISHSDNYISIIISNKNVSLDIQTPKKNILKAHSLFVSEEEKNNFNMEDINHLQLIWSAKEALFKYYGTTQNHIFTDFRIHSIDKSNKLISGNQKLKSDSIKMTYLITDDYYLVYTL